MPESRSIAGSPTILLADDDDAIRRVTARILERAGYTVLAASDGAAAVRLAEQHDGQIHLLVSDLMMPGMNGLQLAAQLRVIRPSLPTLFLSGYADATALSERPLHPSERFLQKPFGNDELLATIFGILTGPTEQRTDRE
jgi:two-component system cell cycle sensor histidine kinase/response regulator CckA